MTRADDDSARPPLFAEWPFPRAAALGSRVRAEGIVREIKGRLAFPDRKHLLVQDEIIRLTFEAGEEQRIAAASRIVQEVLDGIGALPVLPREVDDILTILPRERLKWTKDGRLRSVGTRTVKLRGRAKAVTFHVFDPRHIEDVLDRDLASIWRAEDAEAAAENRRRAAGKAAMTRGSKPPRKRGAATERSGPLGPKPSLREWEAFDAEGLLR
ncbi:hypothetical protein [Aureimonas sp. AU22]|uniref:hypothetical protein n=1 Tax=Aureimonas sp. AU22 TaxID=1638162 RepID=UPI0007842C35|nr:hypothetical protein [Aureimonas sp. AU22]